MRATLPLLAISAALALAGCGREELPPELLRLSPGEIARRIDCIERGTARSTNFTLGQLKAAQRLAVAKSERSRREKAYE